MSEASAESRDAVERSARELLRAVGGGLLIGLPLLFTMEMWFHSFLLPSWTILLLVVVGFAIVLGYSSVSGFRRERSRVQLVVDAIETVGLGTLVAAVALAVLGRIGPGVDLRDAIGKIALEAVAVAFGISLSRTQLAAADDDEDEEDDEGEEEPAEARPAGPFERLFVAAGAALLFALNVAPTEEPMLLGIEAEWWQLLAVVGVSLAMTLGIVFYADFRGGRAPRRSDALLDHPVTETLAAYAISLGVSLLMLWAFGRTDGAAASVVIGMTVMLGFVAAFGAAAGRLLVGGRSEAA